VPPADKRQRKKENSRLAREAREAELKKRRRNRTIRNALLAVAVFAIALLLINWLSGGKKKNVAVSPTTSTTVAPTTTTIKKTVAYPAGCVATVPKAAKKPTNLKAPAMTADPAKTYTATMKTSCGDVTIALDAKNAPKSVNNFVTLARLGYFDGLKWHRISKNPPIVQGGDPLGTGNGGPGYTTTVELPPDGKYPAGAVAWAKTGADPDGSAGSQFFVDTGDASSIGAHYGYIGTVSTGLANFQKMTKLLPAAGDGAPLRPLYIFKVTITES
jgi:cyclophilin family peptidyl-prolyl cis-trans isomerase